VNCRACEPLLSPFLDGELAPARAAEVEAHLAGCARCAAAKQELARMVQAARALPSPEPPAALWTRIDARLDEKRPRRRWIWLVAPSLAAGLTIAVFALLHRNTPSDDALLADAQSEFRQAEAHYARAADDLRRLVERERPRWPADQQRRHDEALARFDRAIAEARAQAHARVDPAAEEQLLGAWRGEIAYLEDALLRKEAMP